MRILNYKREVKMVKKTGNKTDDWKYTHDPIFGTPMRAKKNGKTQKLTDDGNILHPGPRRWKNC